MVLCLYQPEDIQNRERGNVALMIACHRWIQSPVRSAVSQNFPTMCALIVEPIKAEKW